MSSFLKRVWATLASFPIYAGTLSVAVSEGARQLSQSLPGHAAVILEVGADAASVIAFGSWAVTRLTPVAKEARGFPTAPLKVKITDLQDALAANAELEQQVRALQAQLKMNAVTVPPTEPVAQ